MSTSFRANDIDKATAAKFKVEQKQREEAKVRKDENSAFANTVRLTQVSHLLLTYFSLSLQFFKSVGEAWIYANPLNHRLTLEQQGSS